VFTSRGHGDGQRDRFTSRGHGDVKTSLKDGGFAHLVVLGRHGCIFGLVGQISKLVGEMVGQSAEVIGVGVRLGHLGGMRNHR